MKLIVHKAGRLFIFADESFEASYRDLQATGKRLEFSIIASVLSDPYAGYRLSARWACDHPARGGSRRCCAKIPAAMAAGRVDVTQAARMTCPRARAPGTAPGSTTVPRPRCHTK